jgi:hypothetical protein
MKTLYERINEILGRNCPALSGVSAEAISVIRELEARLEDAQELFKDLDDGLKQPQLTDAITRGIFVTDTVAGYATRDRDTADE